MTAITNQVGTNKGFVGCVEQIVVNSYKYDMRKAGLVGDAQFGVNIGMYTVKILSFRTDRSGQMVQTQIRLLLEEQSDQGLHCLQFCLHLLNALLYG